MKIINLDITTQFCRVAVMSTALRHFMPATRSGIASLLMPGFRTAS